MKWHSVTAPEALRRLDTDAARGLTEEAARRRLSESGPNALREKKKTGLAVKFFQQFNDFMIMILLAAAAVSFGVSWINGERDFVDPIIILAIVVLNAVLGLVQESRAEKSLEALKKLSSPAAKVLRDGKCLHIEAEKLTPGDMILLETGDCVPADGRLITSVNLRVGESALTGESSEAEKNAALICPENAPLGDRRNMVFSGGFVAYGRGTAVVTATGMDTEVGRIAGMIMTHEAPETPLQKKLEATGKTLGAVALSICAAIFIMGVIRRIPPFQMFMTSVSLAVAAIPEGLPAIVTIMLALGVQRMAKANAIIRKLPAVETLGGATVICSDKTGTLTQNKMRVAEVECEAGRETILTYAALCSNAILESKGEISGDPTETALVLAALAAGLNKNTLEKRWKRVEEIPFDSDRKLMTTLHRAPDGAYISVTKGAPDVLLNQCTRCAVKGNVMNLTAEKRQEWNAKNAKMADKALRVLAVAYDGDQTHAHENGLIFAGLIGLIDPPRPEAAEAVAVCRQAGIKPVMITGDHVVTARAIAKKIGILSIGDKSITGQDISEMSDGEFARRVEEFSVFARVSPEHKVKIVKALQEKGAVVAMTGDGVNDAPALKAADIGCAMGLSGTDVAKEAADMVLTDDNFATIVKAVQEGRGIYDNISKAVHFLLSSNIGEIMTVFTAIFMGWHTPLAAIHLLWVNLVTDSLPAIALGMDPPDKDIMKQKPRVGNLFADGMVARIALEGMMIGFLALTAFGVGAVYYDAPGSRIIGRTMCFATLSMSQLVHAFNMRSKNSIFRIDLLDNLFLIGALIIGVIMQVSVISVPYLSAIFKVSPLHHEQWMAVAALSFMPLVIVELQKLFTGLSEHKKEYA